MFSLPCLWRPVKWDTHFRGSLEHISVRLNFAACGRICDTKNQNFWIHLNISSTMQFVKSTRYSLIEISLSKGDYGVFIFLFTRSIRNHLEMELEAIFAGKMKHIPEE